MQPRDVKARKLRVCFEIKLSLLIANHSLESVNEETNRLLSPRLSCHLLRMSFGHLMAVVKRNDALRARVRAQVNKLSMLIFFLHTTRGTRIS